jgi:GNAT superfamily N-acetyltransferase
MLSTVATFNELPEAYVLRGRLSAEGIPSWIAHELQIANDWFRATARQGACVQVAAGDAADAWAIIRAAGAGDFKASLRERFGEIDDLRCPACGSTDCWKRRSMVSGPLALAFGVLMITIPPLQRWMYFCNACACSFHSTYGLIGKADARSQFALDFAEADAGEVPEMLEVRLSVLENRLHVDPDTESARYRDILRAGGKAWVCRVGGFVRAFAIADPAAKRLHALFVHPCFKRDGMGRHLHNAAVDWLFAQGLEEIRLATEPVTAAERFFRKAGWRPEDYGEMDDYIFQLEPDIWRVRRRRF